MTDENGKTPEETIDEILEKRFKKLSKDFSLHYAIRHFKNLGITARDIDEINRKKLAGNTNLPGESLLEKWFRGDEQRPFTESEKDIIDLALILKACLESLNRIDTIYPMTLRDDLERIQVAENYVNKVLCFDK